MSTIRMGAIALDCREPAPLARFWSELLGGEISFSTERFAAVHADSVWLTMQRIDDYREPTWPGGTLPKQIHLDLAVDDLDATEARAVALGAERAADQPAPDRFRVFLDPAGHPFCLTTQMP